jgi:dolichyl-phosphate-mannose-protein mannosyltransferase
MASVQQRRPAVVEKSQSSRSPGDQSKTTTLGKTTKQKDYGSEGVRDNDIFLLPGSDFQLLGVLTMIATVVRLFRIYQPTSVVFDEVQ